MHDHSFTDLKTIKDLGIVLEGSQGWAPYHRPDDLDTAIEAVMYLEDRREGQSLEDALAEIRTLNSEEIKALRLGLTREEIIGHDWFNPTVASKTLSYLKTQSELSDIHLAMAKIKGKSPVDNDKESLT